MDLAHGGHLTHGHPVNFSGKRLQDRPLRRRARTPSRSTTTSCASWPREHQPKMIVCGACAYPRIIDFARIAEIADEVGAMLMADMAHIAGLVAGGRAPVARCRTAHFVTTTTHKTLRGPRGGMILCKAECAKAIDKAVFPGVQGGPLMHVIAAKAVAFGEALDRRVQGLHRADRSPTPRPWRRACRPRAAAWSPAAPTTTSCWSTCGADGHHRQEGRGAPRQGRHHGQQEHHPVRHPQAAHRPAASASARRPSPPAAWASPR